MATVNLTSPTVTTWATIAWEELKDWAYMLTHTDSRARSYIYTPFGVAFTAMAAVGFVYVTWKATA